MKTMTFRSKAVAVVSNLSIFASLILVSLVMWAGVIHIIEHGSGLLINFLLQ